MNSSTTTLWIGLLPMAGCLVSFYYTTFFFEIPVFNANNIDPGQMPHSAASDLGRYCFMGH